MKVCKLHDICCPLCGYNGGYFHFSNVRCPNCKADWVWVKHSDYHCLGQMSKMEADAIKSLYVAAKYK